MTFDGLLADLGRRVARAPLPGLAPVVDWLRQNRPPAPARPAICHGDLHPSNILMANGAVSGVVDWPNAIVADPAYDVAATRVILGLVPLAVLGLPAALRAVVALARPLVLSRYLSAYRRGGELPSRRLAYYEVAGALRHLVRAGEQRIAAAAAGRAPGALEASEFAERLCAHVGRVTGVTPSVPARP
jgi:aminoglycoside phosphotransferase (APT) family kinase protein